MTNRWNGKKKRGQDSSQKVLESGCLWNRVWSGRSGMHAMFWSCSSALSWCLFPGFWLAMSRVMEGDEQ